MEELQTTNKAITRSRDTFDEKHASSVRGTTTVKVALLILLGFLWSARIVAIKAASLSGIPVHVTVTTSVLGIAILFSAIAFWRRSWPPCDRGSLVFYLLNGALGFVLPFTLENLVAPKLPTFVFVVIISTMPVMTLALVAATRTERLSWVQVMTIGLGFCVALLIASDTAFTGISQTIDWSWMLLAFGVPAVYAVNTVFVASHWPQSADAMHVAQAQALIISMATLLGTTMSGSITELELATKNLPAIASIALGEGIALLVYLKITRDFGASFVSFANYISMVFAAILGALFFGDRLTWLSLIAAGILVLALTLNRAKTDASEPN